MRVLEWMLKRVEGSATGQDSAIGVLPQLDEINREGLTLSDEVFATLLAIDKTAWRTEIGAIADYLEEFGAHTPKALFDELDTTAARLE
jgi:phosphoenolpyruvate carboxykinase (GTP)